ncbi:membrane-bound metal-dependent hydrolase [Halovivax asiaticus JCM 14624]|uniref:Membrane-bound metal-dependent hydrolase n=1 Tax=Halovivax asiaticus JCM 14624 TaxID=1227490 RepID=M0BKL3_9EURY|nr:metal-dependent hydrolase [Halovivax asiaticus]ELZ10992.1 membrane-bound metal-dependent hydrolase [Halovivax asiaticus JCM 14624]
MWPWEHVAFAYLLASLISRGVYGKSPDGRVALAAGFGALFPDLVDKPLSWTVGVFPSGYAVAHSAFVYPVFALLVWSRLGRRGSEPLAVAFLVGHASHLVGDVVYPFVLGDELALTAVLWPILPSPPAPTGAGLIARTTFFLREWVVRLRALELGPLFVFELALAGAVVAVWLYDGAPVVAECRSILANWVDGASHTG